MKPVLKSWRCAFCGFPHVKAKPATRMRVDFVEEVCLAVIRCSHPNTPDFAEIAGKLLFGLSTWKAMKEKFTDQEQYVIDETLYDILAPRLKLVLNSFMESIYDASTDHTKVLAYLTHINKVTARVFEPTSQPKFAAHHEALAMHAFLHGIQKLVAKQEEKDLATTNKKLFVYKLDATTTKLENVPNWLLTFDGDEQRCLWNTLKSLLKPAMVGILSKLFESPTFRVSACAPKLLRLLEFLSTHNIKVDEAVSTLKQRHAEACQARLFHAWYGLVKPGDVDLIDIFKRLLEPSYSHALAEFVKSCS